ncbi:hypothetical protein B566_EDAN008861 [Ephemera danica]|nr:hypothetical protein B566_EDAN008861 [Ephemera danica]
MGFVFSYSTACELTVKEKVCKPQPTVQWWREQELIESTDVLSPFPNVKENKLVVRRLDRGDLHAKYTCQASNNKINPPVSASVSIEMHCE